MNEQGNLLDKVFDPEMAESEKIRGTEQSLGGLSLDDWKLAAQKWVADLWPGATFTADTLVASVGLPTECDLFARCNNAVGGILMQLSRQGNIRPLGYIPSTRVSSRGRVVRVWERV